MLHKRYDEVKASLADRPVTITFVNRSVLPGMESFRYGSPRGLEERPSEVGAADTSWKVVDDDFYGAEPLTCVAMVDWPGLLKWSTKYHDGTAPTEFKVLSAAGPSSHRQKRIMPSNFEREKFLNNVLHFVKRSAGSVLKHMRQFCVFGSMLA